MPEADPVQASDPGASGTSAASNQWHDVRALARFEAFLFSAVITVLIVRAALAATGYPQVGGNGLHIAHVLYGGLLMGLAITLLIIIPGSRVRGRAALIGGIGFGLFIDEVGKFLTKDVNYFFKPAVAIMYAVFVAAYLIVRVYLKTRRLDDRRRLALATTALTDLALGQLDRNNRDYALALLDGVDETGGLAEAADAVRHALRAEPPERRSIETWLSGVIDRLDDPLEAAARWRGGNPLVVLLLVFTLADLAVGVAVTAAHPGKATGLGTTLDTYIPAGISAAVLVAGAVLWISAARGRSEQRRRGISTMQWGILVQLLIVQLVEFNRIEWFGLFGFFADLALMLCMSVVERTDAGRPVLG